MTQMPQIRMPKIILLDVVEIIVGVGVICVIFDVPRLSLVAVSRISKKHRRTEGDSFCAAHDVKVHEPVERHANAHLSDTACCGPN